jgi:hypothetical protein
MRKRIPKGRVRRMVVLDHEALSWLHAVLKDERYNVTERKQMPPDWEAKYDKAERQVITLLQAAERG